MVSKAMESIERDRWQTLRRRLQCLNVWMINSLFLRNGPELHLLEVQFVEVFGHVVEYVIILV